MGSRGDVAPLVGVGRRLREAGYAVTLAAFWSYRMTMLGVTPGAIRFEKLTQDGLADVVR